MTKKKEIYFWTKKERDFLKECVDTHGLKSGLDVASYRMKHRTRQACEWQFYNNIKPKVKTKRRTTWTAEEIDTFKQYINTYGVKNAISKISKKFKRTEIACSLKYRRDIKNSISTPIVKKKIARKSISISPKITKKLAKVLYHNGTTTELDIILQKDNLIVAKKEDIVITIDL